MDAALLGRRFAQRQRDVDGLGGRRASRAADFRISRRAVSAWVTLSLARLIVAPCALAFVGRHLAERRQQRGDRALLAERRDAHGLERGFVAGRGDLGEDFGFELGEIGHGDDHLLGARAQSGTQGRPHPRSADDPVTPWARMMVGGYRMLRFRGHDDRSCEKLRRFELTPQARPWPFRRSPGTPPARG